MPILNYTTKVAATKTATEIQQILVSKGARKVIFDYNENQTLAGLTFHVPFKDSTLFFALPCNWPGVLKSMKAGNKIPDRLCTPEQAQRVAWRILKTWIEAQMALVEAELASLPEIFLPYAITQEGQRLFVQLTEKPDLLLKA